MVQAWKINLRGSYLCGALLSWDIDGISGSRTTTMVDPGEHFSFHRPKVSWCATGREEALLRAPGPCNYLQVQLSHTGEIPIRNVSSTPHRRGQQLPLSWQWKLTQNATKSTSKPSSVQLQQQTAVWTWPTSFPIQGNVKQQTCPLQGISRAPESQGIIWFHWSTGQTDVINKQQLGIVSTCPEGISNPDTKGSVSPSCILSSTVILHTSQLHLGAFSVTTILFGKLFQNSFFFFF